MRLHFWKHIMSAIFVLFLIAGVVHAMGNVVTFKADKAGRGATGDVVIMDNDFGQKEITINLSGLKPFSTYTVWLVNMKPKMDMAGLGMGDFSFKSSFKGNEQYVARISKTEFEKWQLIEIAYHPDNDPHNMKTMKIALKAHINMD